MASIDPLDAFWFSNRGLPTVFDQEIDYFTILSNLRAKINETIDLVNTLEAEFGEISTEFTGIKTRLTTLETKVNTLEATLKAYIDEQIEIVEAELDTKFNTLQQSLQEQIDDLIEDFEDYKTTINSVLSDFNTRLDNFNDYMVQRFQELTNYVDTTEEALRALIQVEIDDLQNQIDNLVFELPDIYNPVQGKNTSIQQAIIDLYNIARTGSITAQEFDDLAITAQAFDNLAITALNFDLYAKTILIGG